MLLVIFRRNKGDWFTLKWILRTNPEVLTQTFSLRFEVRKIRRNSLLLTSLRKHHQSKINQKMSSKNNLKNVYLTSFDLIYCLTLLWTLFQLSVSVFVVFCLQEYFSHMWTAPLSVKGLQKFSVCTLPLRSLSREGFLSCHTCCNWGCLQSRQNDRSI